MDDDDQQHDDQPQAETPSTGDAWGDPIDEARKQELWARLRAWWEETDHGELQGPFAGERLTGAEVFWLAVSAIAGPEADAEAMTTAEQQLRAAATDSSVRYKVDLPQLHLEQTNLNGAYMEKAILHRVHLEGAYLNDAHLEGAYLNDAQLQGATLGYTHLQGAYLSGAQLQGAILSHAQMERTSLNSAHLERANLNSAQLKRADLGGAYLDRTDLFGADLQEATFLSAKMQMANLFGAQLEGANLGGAQLQGADLGRAQLQGVDLSGVQMQGADLRRASMDKQTQLDRVILTDVRLDGVIFDNTNLSAVDWTLVPILQDERVAQQRWYGDETSWSKGKRKSRIDRKDQYQAAVRAYRRLAVALQANGLNEEASEYTYRAQVMQRRAYWYGRAYGRWAFSALLAVLAGYGYRLGRILLAYAIILLTFALAYYLTGILVPGSGKPLAWYEALLVSFTAIHGRVFIGQFGLDSVYSWIAGIEAVAGIVIEGVFVAMLIQRFFSR